MRSRKLAPALAVVACAGLMSLAPAVASADTYAPGTNAQTFATSVGGWTESDSSTGLCVPAVTCPVVTPTFQGSGGAGGAGDGFIRSSVIGLLAVGTTTDSVWQSPQFAYNGNGGLVPATATFTMDRQADVTALLAVAGNQANYSVQLFDVTAGSGVTVAPSATQAGAASWTAIPAISINPSQLTIGHQYRIRVTSSYTNGAGAFILPMGSSDYDNVRVTTAGAGANGGSEVTNSSQLTQLILTQGLPNSATLQGNKLLLKVKCPKQAKPNACKYVLRGLAKGKKSKPATGKKKVKIKAGKVKKVKIKVKPKFLAKYQKAKKVFVKAKVQVGTVKATVVKKMKLIH